MEAQLEEAKRIYKIAKEGYNLLFDLKDRCYAENIPEFDRLHDDLHYQVEGIVQSINEFKAEVHNGCDISGYESEFVEVLALAKKIDKFHKMLKKASSKNFNWIYG